MTRHRPLLVVLVLFATACGAGSGPGDGSARQGTTTAAPTGPTPLSGMLSIDPGTCEDGPVTSGSYFRMVQSGGDLQDGPFVPNGDSPCGDASYTPLEPGTDGGLRLGEHQPTPDPPFDEDGHGLADRITAPQPWFAVRFALSTNPTDPQTGQGVPPPSIVHDGSGRLTGDVRALAASWNGQHFNQGSPKPDGSQPGHTRPVTGTYDPATGAYTLEWASQIVGGPFDGFTGVWYLEGTVSSGAD